MARRLSSFQRLALWTTGITYVLILVGGLVRASGAGLGCPDWPRCFGSWVPPASAADLPPGFEPSQFNETLMWTEYLNRLLGVTVGLLIFATLVSAWRHHRREPRIFWPTLAAFLLVGFQGWLGGVVVQQELAAWLVTLHMVVALVIVSLLLYVTVYAFFPREGATPVARHAHQPLTAATAGVIAISLVQVVVGTQVRERVDEALAGGTARDAALATVGAFDRWHRDAALLVLAGTIWLAWLVWTRHREHPSIRRVAATMMGLVAAQVALGASMAYISLAPWAQVAHLTVASLLLGAETVLFLLGWYGVTGRLAGAAERRAASAAQPLPHAH